MKRREIILAAGLGSILAIYGTNWIYQTVYAVPLQDRQDRTTRLREDIAKRELDLAKIAKAGKDLKRWRSQALPSDREVARSQYQAWLVELVGAANLDNPNVDSSEPVVRKGLYDSFNFSLRGRGTLQQLTRLLFDFYRADHLHQIQSLSLTPVPRSDTLDIALSIEALSLSDADRKDRLSNRVSDCLASNDLNDYRSIAERNLFGISSGADEADLAYLTAITQVNGAAEAWFTLRGTGQLLKLREQQSFEIGPVHGIVAEILPSEVILVCDEERWLLSIGDNLANASTLPPEF